MAWDIPDIGLFAVVFVFMLGTALLLARVGQRKTVCALVVLGLGVSVLKVLVVQQAPQWLDISPDSVIYEMNARAFAEHWSQRIVDSDSHVLRGLMMFYRLGIHAAYWFPEDWVTYSSVVGAHEWLYTVYVASWYWLTDATQSVVIFSNVIWAAFFPAAAFGIALNLGANTKVAWIAAALALMDPSAGVNASWLLKDALAGFLALSAIWGLLAYMRGASLQAILVAMLALGALGLTRYVAFVGIVLSILVVVGWLLFRRQRSMAAALMVVLLGAWTMNGFLARVPQVSFSAIDLRSLVAQVLGTPGSVLAGSVAVLYAEDGDAQADPTVLNWKQDLSQQPLRAIIRSGARTLFAPYPWVALTDGLTWTSFSELYYPGMVLWILCLPGIAVAVVCGIRQRDPVFFLVLLFLGSQLAAYTIWLGEWSTRQRVFALPIFFALAAIGWSQLRGFYWDWRHSIKTTKATKTCQMLAGGPK